MIGLFLALIFLALAFLAHNYYMKTSCEGIFQQTQLNLASSIEVLELKGEIGFANDKIQDLTESAQLVALNLKACCVAADNGLMPQADFLQCKNSAGKFEMQIAQAAKNIVDARDANAEGKSQEAIQKSAEAQKVLRQSDKILGQMPKSVVSSPKIQPSGTTSELEKEPNNDLFEGTPVALESSTSGELENPEDVDVFQIKNSSNLRDWIVVKLENKSQKFAPEVEVYDDKRRSIVERYETSRGASLEIQFVADATQDHYVAVRSWNRSGSGPYSLHVEPSRYYDKYEPNDGAATATPLKVGETVEATILDGKDSDWYQVEVPNTGTRRISLKNMKGKLKPEIAVYNASKSKLTGNYDTTEGADLDLSVDVPTTKFYVRITPWNDTGWGRYSVTVQ
jgi:hypothetical protein